MALIFDGAKIESSWFGNEVFKHVIPLLDPRTKDSILHGDDIGDNEHQDIPCQAFRDAVCPARPITCEHSTQFQVIYINNLTDAAFQKPADGLMGFEGYVGRARELQRGARTFYHSAGANGGVQRHEKHQMLTMGCEPLTS